MSVLYETSVNHIVLCLDFYEINAAVKVGNVDAFACEIRIVINHDAGYCVDANLFDVFLCRNGDDVVGRIRIY